ncbi:MAG: 6-bladed beta-propeller [Balneola sp.]|jgi:WD40 repeat protein
MILYYKFRILILILLLSCSIQENTDIPPQFKKLNNLSIYPADIKPKATIQLVQEESYGSTDSTIVTVGGSDGSILVVNESEIIFIADRVLNSIHAIQTDGQYLTKLGRKGRGPGEFVSLGLMKFQSNNLYIYDSQQLKIHVFSFCSMDYSYTIDLDPNEWSHIEKLKFKSPTNFFVNNDSTLLIKFSPHIQAIENMPQKNYTHSYFYINKQGELISKEILNQRGTKVAFTDFQSTKFSVSLSYHGEPLSALSSNGYIFSAWSEDFLVEVYDASGEYIRSFYHFFERKQLIRDELIEKYDIGIDNPTLKYITNADLPDKWPALKSMFVDHRNRLWVSTIVDNIEVYQWWVLEPTGEVITKFEWPRDKSIQFIQNNSLYTIEKGADGANIVVKYKIVLKKGE